MTALSPDCSTDHNHHKCDGSAWDLGRDQEVACTCSCHQEEAPPIQVKGLRNQAIYGQPVEYSIRSDAAPAVTQEDIRWPDTPVMEYSFQAPVHVSEAMEDLAADLMRRTIRAQVEAEESAMLTMLSVIMDQLGLRQIIITPEELKNVRPGIDLVRDVRGNQVIINRHQFDGPVEAAQEPPC